MEESKVECQKHTLNLIEVDQHLEQMISTLGDLKSNLKNFKNYNQPSVH